MKEKKFFTNERLTANKKDGLIEVTFSFTYKNKVIKRYYFLGHSDDARDIINREKEDGTLLKYAKKYSRKLYWNTSRKIWASCGAALAAGVIAVGAYFTIQILNSPTENLWPKINVEKAKEIISDFEETQGLVPFETDSGSVSYNIDENNLKLLDILKENGGQGRIIDNETTKITSEGETQKHNSSYNIPFNLDGSNLYFMDPTKDEDSSIKSNLRDVLTTSGYYLYRDDLQGEDIKKTVYLYTDKDKGKNIKEGDKPKICLVPDIFKGEDYTIDNARKLFEKKYFYDLKMTPNQNNTVLSDDSLAALLFGVNTKLVTGVSDSNPGVLALTDLYFLHPEGVEIETPFKISEKFENVCFRSISNDTINIDITLKVFLQFSMKVEDVEFSTTSTTAIKSSGKIINGLLVEESIYQNEKEETKMSGEVVDSSSYECNGTYALTFCDVPIPDTADWPLPTPENK